MWFNGMVIRRNKKLAYRRADPMRDVDDDGRPLKSNYIVIVRMKDCRLFTQPGDLDRFGMPRQYYDPEEAPQTVKLGMGGTNYGYGKWRTHRTARRFQTEQGIVTVSEWYSCPVYVVLDGRVYQATHRLMAKPPAMLKEEQREIELALLRVGIRNHRRTRGQEKQPEPDLDEHDDGTMDPNPETFDRESREEP